MQLNIRSAFTKDAKKLSDILKQDVADAIHQIINAEKLADIHNVKLLKGGKKAKNAYRMRIKDHRICFYFENQTVELVRILPRKDVYKVFP
ncbi:type II toxin-antitoxin system RelE/ParE family toxin [Mucilaginibacter sp.]|uniref:type II toxin-antitoxin system RelE family toxin n=1 Tax=Mucilaginibacter sp. TaxID=1882438 RepID=UPI003266BD42